MPKQYELQNKLKVEEQQRLRAEEEQKRRLLDEGIRQANLADAKVEAQKRIQLNCMKDEDRKAKQFQKMIAEAKDRGLPTDQIVRQINSPNTTERKLEMISSPPLKSAGAAIMLK